MDECQPLVCKFCMKVVSGITNLKEHLDRCDAAAKEPRQARKKLAFEEKVRQRIAREEEQKVAQEQRYKKFLDKKAEIKVFRAKRVA